MKNHIGINLGGWLSQSNFHEQYLDTFIIEKDIKTIKEWGANIIRLPIDYNIILEDSNKLLFKKDSHRYINMAISWCNKYDIVCILDFHISPWHFFLDGVEGKTYSFFKNNELIEKHIETLKYIIAPYKDNKRVYLEVLNEPVAENPYDLNKFYEKIIKELRKEGINNTLIFESNRWGMVKDFPPLIELLKLDNNIILSFHLYEPLDFTHQKAPWIDSYRETLEYPYEKNGILYNKKTMKDLFLKEVIKVREKYPDIQILCGEFGVYLEAPTESRYKWLKDVVELFDEYSISWTYWTYKNMDFGIVNTQYQYYKLKEYDNIERIDYRLVDILFEVEN